MKATNMLLLTYENILEFYSNKSFPQKISYAIMKNMVAISNELEPYRKSMNKVLENYKDYFIKDKNGEPILSEIGVPKVDEEHTKDYKADIDELLNLEIDVNDLYSIDEDVFEYEDSERYDSMNARDIINLKAVLCNNNAQS